MLRRSLLTAAAAFLSLPALPRSSEAAPAGDRQVLLIPDAIFCQTAPSAQGFYFRAADNGEATRQADERAYQWATDLLFDVRKQRSEAKQPLKVPITKVTVRAEADAVALMPIVEADLKAALRVQAFESAIGEPREIMVQGYEAALQG